MSDNNSFGAVSAMIQEAERRLSLAGNSSAEEGATPKQAQEPMPPEAGAPAGMPPAPGAAPPGQEGVGQPVPPEMIQQGMEQMVPPPGAASGVPPEGQQADPIMQLGGLIEQIAMEWTPLLVRIADSNDRIEKQLVFLSGATAGEQAAAAANPMPEPPPAMPGPPKVASDQFVPARGREGVVASRGRDSDISELTREIQKVSDLAEAVSLLQRQQH